MRRWLSAPSCSRTLIQFLAQFFDIGGPAVFIANGVDVEYRAFEFQFLEKAHQHFDHFGVDAGRVGLPENFRANLIELAVAALLRAFAPEHWSHVVELDVAGLDLHAMLDVRAHDGGGGFGTQRNRRVIAVLERIHFLGNDVCFLPDRAREELSLLENRYPNFGESECAEHVTRGLLDPVP